MSDSDPWSIMVDSSAIDLLSSLPSCVDLIVTDPPYGIDYKSHFQGVNRRLRNLTGESQVIREDYFSKITGDKEIPLDWIPFAYSSLVEGGGIYIFCSWKKIGELQRAVESVGFTAKNLLVLEKSNHGMGDLIGSYAPKYEMLLFASKGRHTLDFPDGRQPDVRKVKVKFSGARRLHPNEKPADWYKDPIYQSLGKRKGLLICDPFAGSGTCGVAARELGHNFYGGDIDPNYVQVARERLGLT